MLYLQIASPKSSVLNFLDSNSFEVIISIFQRTEKVPDMERLLRYKRRFTLRLFNIGCKQLIESGFTKTLLHGSDTKELLFIWIKSCSDL